MLFAVMQLMALCEVISSVQHHQPKNHEAWPCILVVLTQTLCNKPPKRKIGDIEHEKQNPSVQKGFGKKHAHFLNIDRTISVDLRSYHKSKSSFNMKFNTIYDEFTGFNMTLYDTFTSTKFHKKYRFDDRLILHNKN